jgi:hypothetical protein
MSCSCHTVRDTGPSRRDPTGTGGLRRAMMTAARVRFARLRTALQPAIVSQLGLDRPTPLVGRDDHEKTALIDQWMTNLMGTTVLEDSGLWVMPFVAQGYARGAQDAARHLGQAPGQLSPARPAMLGRLAAVELRGIAAETQRQAVRAAGASIARGYGARRAYNAVVDRVRRVGIHRSELLANTAIVSAHAHGALDTYARAGVRQVALQAERVPRPPVTRDVWDPDQPRDPDGKWSGGGSEKESVGLTRSNYTYASLRAQYVHASGFQDPHRASVPIENLRATQEYVFRGGGSSGTEPVKAMLEPHTGLYHLINGHHRVEEASRKGETHVLVDYYVLGEHPLTDARTPRARVQQTLVQVVTAGDDLVCQQCQDIEDDNPYRIQEALGLIPAHPNCRCAWVPWDEDDDGEED